MKEIARVPHNDDKDIPDVDKTRLSFENQMIEDPPSQKRARYCDIREDVE
jgi:hypothetical protein